MRAHIYANGRRFTTIDVTDKDGDIYFIAGPGSWSLVRGRTGRIYPHWFLKRFHFPKGTRFSLITEKEIEEAERNRKEAARVKATHESHYNKVGEFWPI